MRGISAVASGLIVGLVVCGVSVAQTSGGGRTNEQPRGAARAGWPWDGSRKNVAIVVHEGVELLDFAGPFEVFQASGSPPAFNVYTVAPGSDSINSLGLTVAPKYPMSACPKPDIIVVPGGATGRLTQNAEAMAWLKESAGSCEIVMSVCTGAFALQKVGLLDGLKEVTTHWGSVDALAKQMPDCRVRNDVRFVDNGKIITTAGISAGIDGALHVVERLLGAEDAWRTARYMQYEWEPSAEALKGKKRDAVRFGIMGKWAEAEKAWTAILGEEPNSLLARVELAQAQLENGHPDLTVKTLKAGEALGHATAEVYRVMGRAQLMTKDNAGAVQSYEKAVELGTNDSTTIYNFACACALAGQKDKALDSLERAIAAGFRGRWYLENDSDLESIRSDARFKALLEKTR